MKFNVIAGNLFQQGQNRLFPVRTLADGSQWIKGTAPGEPDEYGTAIAVFAATGGLAPTCPDPDTGAVWYQVHLGDFVAVHEYGSEIADLIVYSYQIQFIGPDNLAHGVPATL